MPPLRPARTCPGWQRTPQRAYDPDQAPPELRPALTGSRPWKRLAAFARLPHHPGLRATAHAFGLHHTTLTAEGHALAQTVTAFLEHLPATTKARLTTLAATDPLTVTTADSQEDTRLGDPDMC